MNQISELTDLPLTISTPSLDVDLEQANLAGGLAARRLWALVRLSLRRSRLGQSDVARRLGVNRSTVSRALASPSSMTIDRAGRLIRAAGYYIKFDLEPVTGHIALYKATDEVKAGSTISIRSIQDGDCWLFKRYSTNPVRRLDFSYNTAVVPAKIAGAALEMVSIKVTSGTFCHVD